jgi:hypothetical protein
MRHHYEPYYQDRLDWNPRVAGGVGVLIVVVVGSLGLWERPMTMTFWRSNESIFVDRTILSRSNESIQFDRMIPFRSDLSLPEIRLRFAILVSALDKN